MDGGISFGGSGGEEEKRPRRRREADIEYTSGAELEAAARMQRAEEPAKPAPVKEPKKRGGFALWRRRQKAPAPTTPIHEGMVIDHEHDEAPDLKSAMTQPVVTEQTKPAPAPVQPAPAPDFKADATQREELGEHQAPVMQHVEQGPDLKAAMTQPSSEMHQPVPPKASKKKSKKEKKKKAPAGKTTTPPLQEQRLDVNLIPHSMLDEHRAHNYLLDLIAGAIACIVIVLAAFGGLKWYQAKIEVDTRDTENEIANVEVQIAQFSELQTKAKTTNDRLEGVEEVLQNHVYWTPFLELIESLTLPTVYYKSMTGSAETGSFTFDAVALDYGQVEPQVEVLRRSPLVKQVTTTSATELLLTLQPEETEEGEEPSPEETEAPKEIRLVNFVLTVDFDEAAFRFPRSVEQQQ